MQVYHETVDGEKGIISFLLEDNHNAPNLDFFEQLGALMYEPEAGYEEILE
jgi:hypothetical protein